MTIDLQINGQTIHVRCELPVTHASYSFALGRLLNLNAAVNNGRPIEPVRVEPCELPFRPAMMKYSFSDLEQGTLLVEYEGALEGIFLFMQKEIYHFSLYNGWYPIGFDAEERYFVRVHAGEDYQLINGDYDPLHGFWQYCSDDQEIIDCNILLLQKSAYHCIRKGRLSFWYLEPSHADYARRLTDIHTSICQFYQKLYGHVEMADTSIVVLPEKYQYGAYQRDRLTVFSELSGRIEDKVHGLAHELGHMYGTGADTGSWEDWLNETHAEWSALLYMRECCPETFHSLAVKLEQQYQAAGSLRPNGDARPDEVHDTGTLLYYGIFKEWGVSEVEALLRIFDRLAIKDTSHFLEALKDEHPASYQLLLSKC